MYQSAINEPIGSKYVKILLRVISQHSHYKRRGENWENLYMHEPVMEKQSAIPLGYQEHKSQAF